MPTIEAGKTWLGPLGFGFAIPMILIPPFAGEIVDRAHRICLLFFMLASLFAARKKRIKLQYP